MDLWECKEAHLEVETFWEREVVCVNRRLENHELEGNLACLEFVSRLKLKIHGLFGEVLTTQLGCWGLQEVAVAHFDELNLVFLW